MAIYLTLEILFGDIMEYGDKYVIYFDILGFKNMIYSKSCEDIYNTLQTNIKNIHHANFNDILLVKCDDGSLDIDFEDGDIKHGNIAGEPNIISCSDSVFITLDKNDIQNTYQLFQYIAEMQGKLIENGIMIRGGCAYGQVFHDGSVIYGPAVVGAVELEKKMENYPFIGLTPNVFQHFKLDELEFLTVFHNNVYCIHFLYNKITKSKSDMILCRLNEECKKTTDNSIIEKITNLSKYIQEHTE